MSDFDALPGADKVGGRLEIHEANDWAALYQDGNLVSVGDSYVAVEKALAKCGVITVQDASFMRGQTQRSGVAPTLDDVEKYKAEREQKETSAAELRAQAAALLEEASQLDGQRPVVETPIARPDFEEQPTRKKTAHGVVGL